MNKGTQAGTAEEVNFTKILNKKNDKSFWNQLNLDPENHWAIRVISYKYGLINAANILPKADVFIAKGFIPDEYLKNNDYFLDEDDVERFGLVAVEKTGISIKRKDSRKYQIMKMSPSTFEKVFGSNLLSAGASIYCSRDHELIKNKDVLSGWGVDENVFLDYFNSNLELKINSVSDISTKHGLKKIKKYSNFSIKKIIKETSIVSDFVFFGIGNFSEPFTARWIYKHGKFEINRVIPFNVTTGSGRSKGIYTIVIKPKT